MVVIFRLKCGKNIIPHGVYGKDYVRVVTTRLPYKPKKKLDFSKNITKNTPMVIFGNKMVKKFF